MQQVNHLFHESYATKKKDIKGHPPPPSAYINVYKKIQFIWYNLAWTTSIIVDLLLWRRDMVLRRRGSSCWTRRNIASNRTNVYDRFRISDNERRVVPRSKGENDSSRVPNIYGNTMQFNKCGYTYVCIDVVDDAHTTTLQGSSGCRRSPVYIERRNRWVCSSGVFAKPEDRGYNCRPQSQQWQETDGNAMGDTE